MQGDGGVGKTDDRNEDLQFGNSVLQENLQFGDSGLQGEERADNMYNRELQEGPAV